MTVLISHTWHTFNDDVYSDVVVLKDEVHPQMLLISRGALFDAGDILRLQNPWDARNYAIAAIANAHHFHHNRYYKKFELERISERLSR